MNSIISAVPEIRWPSLPTPKGARLLGLQYQFRFTEVSSRESRLAAQWRQLVELIRHARTTVPFYRDRLESLAKLDSLRPDWEAWARVRSLTQSELVNVAVDLHSNGVPPEHGKVHPSLVSIAQGQMIELKNTDLSQYFAHALTLREHLWHRRDFRARLAIIDDSPNVKSASGATVSGWGAALDAAFDVASAQVLHVDMPVAVQMKWLRNIKPAILSTSPANAATLAEHFLEHGATLPSLRALRVVGGALPAQLSDNCQRAWSVRPVHVYSVPGVGPIALACPVSGLMHVQSENVLVEVLDEVGLPSKPGEVGRLVLTCLHNFAAPLVRYDIGHRAEVADACTCGRTLPTIRHVQSG